MPNTFAYIALITWPLISILMYQRLRIIPATFGTILGGYLLLPVNVSIDFPLIPAFDKESIPALAAIVGCTYVKKYRVQLIPKSGLERWLIIIFILSPILTVFNNLEPIFWDNGVVLPALTYHDTLSLVIGQYIGLIPIILGIQLVKTYEDQFSIFKLLLFAGLCYSLLILFELRMSPNLHIWTYGFFPTNWLQTARGEGFRAVVFTGHGLKVSIFVAIVLGVSLILWKEKFKIIGFSALLVALYFLGILLLNRSLGSIILGTILFILIAWMPKYTLKKSIIVLALIGVLYPFLSIFELIPYQYLVDVVSDIDAERAHSLAYRFWHQTNLLDHAREKFFFGWGSWGRNRVPGATSEGLWIITIGAYGFVGFCSLYGLFLLGVLRAVRSSRKSENYEQSILLSHALIVAIILLDNVPNTSFVGWMGLFIGALLGRANYLLRGRPQEQDSESSS